MVDINLNDINSPKGSATLINGDFLTFDPLSNNKFSVICPLLPDVTFFLQGFSFPSVSINKMSVPTPYVDYALVGEKLNYQPISMTFLVDKYSRNWSSVFNWMRQMTVNGSTVGKTDNIVLMVDNKPFLRFYGAWPADLTGYELSSIGETLIYVKATVTFQYLYFDYLGEFATVDSAL